MKGSVNISDYFYGAKTQFIIPLYQRKYAWQKKHCVRLFEDLIKIHKEELQSHFFGSIVATKANEVEDDLLIIDKPAPLACQCSPKQPGGTLENRLAGRYGSEFVFRTLNRLDRGPSGLMAA